MDNWSGEDRRTMNQDQIERDRLLTELHSDMKHLVKWSQTHDKQDTDRFASITKDINWGKKIIWMCLGVIVFVEFVSKVVR